MSYQTEVQTILNRYPGIKTIKVELEECFDRVSPGISKVQPVSIPTPVPPTPVVKEDMFELNVTPQPFPSAEKKSPRHLDSKSANALAATMAALNNPPQI